MLAIKERRAKKVLPWEQQPGESSQAFIRFQAYLAQPREARCIADAYRQQTPVEEQKSSVIASWHNMSRKYQWEDRAALYDAEQDRQIEKKLVGRRMSALQETAQLGKVLREKAQQAASLLRVVDEYIGEKDGKPVWLQEAGLTPDQIVRLADVGVKLEQLALGQPTDRVALQNGGTDPVGVALTEAKEELRRRLAQIRERHDESRLLEPPK